MKRLTGTVTLKLTDTATGDVETVQETNMVTDAINDILGSNPLGVWMRTGAVSDQQLMLKGNLLPVCPNMIGGILLFSHPLAESTSNVLPSAANLPVAYASNDVNQTLNTRRGSLNLTESMALNDGYKFVWDFLPEQGNGTIAAVGLTSKKGGMNGFGSGTSVGSSLLMIQKVAVPASSYRNELVRAVSMDFDGGKLFTIKYESGTVTVTEYRIPVFDIGLNELLDDSTLKAESTTVALCSVFEFLQDPAGKPHGIFLDGGDGYWYGFSNLGNSSGNARMLWIRISKSDLSYTEGSWTLAGLKLSPVGWMEDDGPYLEGSRCAVIRGGYLYVPAYDRMKLYKISLSDPTDVTRIDLGFTATLGAVSEDGDIAMGLTLVGDLIVGYGFQVDAGDNVIRTEDGYVCESVSTPFFRYKEFLVAWTGEYGTIRRECFLITPYLATICNLAQSVVKGPSKTMKVTYTLREEVVT